MNTGNSRRQIRSRAGNVGGFAGFGFGLLGCVSAASEGTGFVPRDAALVVLAFMICGYALGWVFGPLLADLLAQSDRR
jgi:hypothetical protein